MLELNGKQTNHLQPFFDIEKGATEKELRARFQKLRDMGIYSMVLCMKTDDGFMGLTKFDDPAWWLTLEHVVKLCKELGMSFWIQDAAPFPTGAAEGWFAEREDCRDKRKLYLTERHINVQGPRKNAVLVVERQCSSIRGDIASILGKLVEADTLRHAVMLPRREENGRICYDSGRAMDITEHIDDGILTLDIPDGIWRIFLIYESRNGGRASYMNLLDETSVAVLIAALYEPHLARLQAEIGHTWNGFFYDEPEVGNIPGYDMWSLPGHRFHGAPAPLPWSKQAEVMLRDVLGEAYIAALPALWYDCGEETGIRRYQYMNIVTQLISSAYNGQMHAWCQKHGIGYIGHALEDEHSHARLGCGPGHYFRMQRHQDMAGIDLVSAQILPGQDFEGISWYGCPDGDGELYHYGLAKLAASEAHINPLKNSRSVCELMALYGSILSAKNYKFYIDHLLVNGINNFIPTGVETLETEPARLLFDYANRMCELVKDAKAVTPVAILYHAEAEWAGKAQFFTKPAKQLATSQIDYDVIPCDALTEPEIYRTRVKDSELCVHTARYSAVVVPFSERLPFAVVEKLIAMHRQDLSIIFVDGRPSGYCDRPGEVDDAAALIPVVTLTKLAEHLKKAGACDVTVNKPQPWLRVHHLQSDERELYLLHNEHPYQAIDFTATFPCAKKLCRYDAMNNRILAVPAKVSEGRTAVDLSLGRYEMAVLCFDDASSVPEAALMTSEEILAVSKMKVSDITPRQTEDIVYRACFAAPKTGRCVLDLGDVGDTARICVNGMDMGLCIAAPYRLDITEAIRPEDNKLVITVTPHQARARQPQAMFVQSMEAAAYAVLDPVGLTEPIRIRCFV